MNQLAGLPCRWIDFDKDGGHTPLDVLCPEGTTDLVVLSHGWKNDRVTALALYEAILDHMQAAGGGAEETLRFAALGVSWPAFKFEADLSLLQTDPAVGQGGAAAFGDGDLPRQMLKEYAARWAEEFGVEDADAFARQAAAAAGGGAAADDLVETLISHCTDPAADPHAAEDFTGLFRSKGSQLVELFSAPPPDLNGIVPSSAGDGVPTDAAAAGFLSDLKEASFKWLAGGKAAVATMLNQFTYYEMKARAGTVGAKLAEIIDSDVPTGVRVHLVGHSFGARLMASAASNLETVKPASMTLLQGAFSHNGFGQRIGGDEIDGAFRSVVTGRTVTGPIAVTHTHRDTAVGFFYAIASTASREIASGFGLNELVGGPKDLHGGMGANGALALLVDEDAAFTAMPGELLVLRPRVINNILADAIIADHNDVSNADVGRVVWASIKGGL